MGHPWLADTSLAVRPINRCTSLSPNLSVRFENSGSAIKSTVPYVGESVNHLLSRFFFSLRGQVEAPATARTMVSGRYGPYQRPYLGYAQSKRINVIPTSWAIIPALGLGVAQVLGSTYDTEVYSVKMYDFCI
jgi:hypothetical protein